MKWVHPFLHNVASMTWASLPIIPFTKSTNGEKYFCWLYQSCPCLYLFIFYHQSKGLSITFGFQVSASESPKIMPMIASVWISHSPRIEMSPHVSGALPPWRTSSSDILRPKWIRGYPHTQWLDWNKIYKNNSPELTNLPSTATLYWSVYAYEENLMV